VILPAILAMAGAPPFGYAKPVPVNQSRLRNPRNHGLLVSLAGPATNIVLAVLVALILRSLPGLAEGGLRLSPDSLVLEMLLLFGVLNVVLAAFNLLPLPPLDGSEVVAWFLPNRWLPAWFKLRRWSMPLLFLVIFLLPGALSRVFDAALRVWLLLL
jgi:Zn-dependent protease